MTSIIIQQDSLIMPLSQFKNSIENFTQRIKRSLRLQQDENMGIHHKKIVMSWIQEQTISLRDQKQEERRNQGLFTGILNLAGMNETFNKIQSEQVALEKVKNIMRGNIIDFQLTDIQDLELPTQVRQSLKKLNKSKIPNYFGVVLSPLFEGFYLDTRQNYDDCIKMVYINDLKFRNLGSDPANIVKHQRNLAEQLFNNMFTSENQLSIVIKIQVQKENFERGLEIFCLIEDVSTQRSIIYKDLDSLEIDQDENLLIRSEENRLHIDEMSFFNCLLNQILTVPLQTIVSNYAIKVEDKTAKIFKTHKLIQKCDLSAYIKEHSSLRNPLFYFSNYIKSHQFSIQAIKSILQLKQFYGNFYQILNMLIDLMKKDYTIKTPSGRISSLMVTPALIEVIWKIFHQIVVLSNWIEEMISPIKKTVTLYEINSKIIPIFNEILKLQKTSFSQYQKILLNLPIQNYLTMNVSKITIEQYKDRFLNVNIGQFYSSQTNFFQLIFQKTIKNYSISNINIYQAIYFLNFIANNHSKIFTEGYIGVHPSWKSRKTWKEVVKVINQQFNSLNYISINLEILALYFDFDMIKHSNHPFQAIKNDTQNPELYLKIELLMKILKQKYERKYNQYLSILLEKSFRYGKFKIVEYMIKKGVYFNNYEEIFLRNHEPEFTGDRDMKAQKLKSITFMKNRQPELFRRYKWQELINVKMKQKAENLVAFQTIRRGVLYVDQSIHSHLTSRNMMNNALSRKDYMFSNNRHIGKINIYESEAYLQITEYPLLRYFYNFFLGKVNKTPLMPNFCGFFTKKGNLVHLIESLPSCNNYKKALSTSCEIDLSRTIPQQDLSQAFVISMMLMPTNVFLKNIFISHIKSEDLQDQGKNNLFIIDFHDFYQKNCFQKNAGNAILKVKNILFAFDEMKHEVSTKIMKKYSNIGVLQIVNSVFKESSALILEVNRLKNTKCDLQEDQRQLFSIIFQNNFCQSLVQRMFKIKKTFEKCLKNRTKITHLQLLEVLNPALSYYYNEIIETSNRLIERQKILMDQSYKKSFIINEGLVSFLSNTYQTEETRQTFPNHYKKFVFEGPTQNLVKLHQNILKFDIYTKKITQFKDYSHNIIEYFIKNIDLSIYSSEERDALINKIQDYSKQYLKKQKNCLPLSIIRFNNLEELKERHINFSGQRLKELIFQETSCTDSEFNTLLRRYQSMRNLAIRNVSELEKIGDSFIAVSDTYDFKNLKFLSIIGCYNLLNIDLKCQQLEQITFRRNPSLTEIFVFSRKLKNMDCYDCPKLRFQNIGIYILKKVNILLSRNCCEGEAARLEDKNYSIFLTRILRYLFNCFQESNTYKLELIMTLIKLELIDEKMLGFKHNQIYNKNLVHIIAKLGPDIVDLVLSQIVDIFLRNDLVDALHLDQLLQINVKHLVIIEDYFLKMIRMKEEEEKNAFRRSFSSLIFKEFNRNRENYNQILSFIKTLINLIDVDKIVQFHFSISKDIFISDYSELISLLNKKKGLQKLELKIENSIITNEFLEYLFTLDGPRNRICRIQFIYCQLKVNSEILIAMLPFIKSLIFTSSRIASLDFIDNFTNLTNLQLNSCSFDHQIYDVYEHIGKLKSLLNLSLINLKANLKNKQLYLSRLMQNLMKLHKLQLFDFSDNELNKQQLSFFSEQIHKVKVYQLNFYNFHQEDLNQYIQFFLYHETIKIIGIEFKIRNIRLFESFIHSLSNNNSIVKVNLKTDQSIESKYFLKIKNNNKIQAIQSNHPVPNWVKNHINNNIINKSISAIIEQDSYGPDMSSREKSEDYCRIGLSLDGGGARGLLLATSMDYISRKVGKPLHKIFDYIGGASIGGILALASTGTMDGNTPICNTQELMDIFQIYGDSIFKKTQFGNIVSIFEPKYDIKSYEDMLYGYFKETKLSDVLKETNVVVNAVNRLTNQDVIFRSINSIFDRNQDFYMKDISRATSAAPIYFPSAEIKNVNANISYSLIDGGVGLNNPSKLVIDDIIKITQNEAHKKNYFLLSLGTGRLRKEAVPSNAGIKDIAPIIDSLTESANYFVQKDLSQNYRGHYLRVSPFVNLSRKDSELDNTTPQTYKAYKQFAVEAAEENYSNTVAFGKFKNQTFIEWLQENTDRKHELR